MTRQFKIFLGIIALLVTPCLAIKLFIQDRDDFAKQIGWIESMPAEKRFEKDLRWRPIRFLGIDGGWGIQVPGVEDHTKCFPTVWVTVIDHGGDDLHTDELGHLRDISGPYANRYNTLAAAELIKRGRSRCERVRAATK